MRLISYTTIQEAKFSADIRFFMFLFSKLIKREKIVGSNIVSGTYCLCQEAGLEYVVLRLYWGIKECHGEVAEIVLK